MLASCPSLRCSCRKTPVSCREAEGLVTQLWCPRFLTILWLCSQLWHETAANQRTLVEIELLATPAFQLPMFGKCDSLPKRDLFDCLSNKESMPSVKSKPPLPTRSLRSLRAAAHSTSSALCLHHAHPFVAAAEKHLSHGEKQRVWSRSCGVHDLLQCSVCAFSCDMRLLRTNEHLSRLSF